MNAPQGRAANVYFGIIQNTAPGWAAMQPPQIMVLHRLNSVGVRQFDPHVAKSGLNNNSPGAVLRAARTADNALHDCREQLFAVITQHMTQVFLQVNGLSGPGFHPTGAVG